MKTSPWRIDFVARDRDAARKHFKADCDRLAPRVAGLIELGTPLRIWIDKLPDAPEKNVSVTFSGFINGAGALEIHALVKLVPKVRA
jgi:hypothetical protein